MNRWPFSRLSLLFFIAFVAIVSTIVLKLANIAPQLRGKSAPVNLIWLGFWQEILASGAVLFMVACIVDAFRVAVPTRSRSAVASWVLAAVCFAVTAIIDWRKTHATDSQS